MLLTQTKMRKLVCSALALTSAYLVVATASASQVQRPHVALGNFSGEGIELLAFDGSGRGTLCAGVQFQECSQVDLPKFAYAFAMSPEDSALPTSLLVVGSKGETRQCRINGGTTSCRETAHDQADMIRVPNARMPGAVGLTVATNSGLRHCTWSDESPVQCRIVTTNPVTAHGVTYLTGRFSAEGRDQVLIAEPLTARLCSVSVGAAPVCTSVGHSPELSGTKELRAAALLGDGRYVILAEDGSSVSMCSLLKSTLASVKASCSSTPRAPSTRIDLAGDDAKGDSIFVTITSSDDNDALREAAAEMQKSLVAIRKSISGNAGSWAAKITQEEIDELPPVQVYGFPDPPAPIYDPDTSDPPTWVPPGWDNQRYWDEYYHPAIVGSPESCNRTLNVLSAICVRIPPGPAQGACFVATWAIYAACMSSLNP